MNATQTTARSKQKIPTAKCLKKHNNNVADLNQGITFFEFFFKFLAYCWRIHTIPSCPQDWWNSRHWFWANCWPYFTRMESFIALRFNAVNLGLDKNFKTEISPLQWKYVQKKFFDQNKQKCEPQKFDIDESSS